MDTHSRIQELANNSEIEKSRNKSHAKVSEFTVSVTNMPQILLGGHAKTTLSNSVPGNAPWRKFTIFHHFLAIINIERKFTMRECDRPEENMSDKRTNSWPRGYKKFFMLNSADTTTYPAHKC